MIVIALAAFVGMEYTVEAINADESFYQNNGWPKIVGAAIGGVVIWFLGNYLNRKTNDRELLDPKTGERMVLQTGGGHSLFFIPMQFWGPIILVLGIVLAFSKP